MFTGDTIFSECTTWLMTSNVDQWITALDRIRALDIDHVIPGHGPVQTKAYLATQRSFMLEWKAAVAVAVAKGWSPRGDHRAGQLRRALPGGYRAGVHDGLHPGAQRRGAVRQVHGADQHDVPRQGRAAALTHAGAIALRAPGCDLVRAGAAGQQDEVLVELEPDAVVAVHAR